MSIEKEIAEKLMSNFASLSDVTLIAGEDQQRFAVPRKIIAQSSKYFDALFGPNFKEGTEEEIVLQNIDGPTLKAVVQFIYIGQIELNKNNIGSILAAASSTEVLSLEQKCDKYLQANLSVQNCMETLVLADKYSFEILRKSALAMVCANYAKISMDDILPINATLFGDILKSDEIEAPETTIFHSLVRWGQQSETEKASYMPELLGHIRLKFMPGEFMGSDVEPVFHKYDVTELFFDECRKRTIASKPNRLHRCMTMMYDFDECQKRTTESKPIYCVSRIRGGNWTVYKYTTSWDKLKDIQDANYNDSGCAFHSDKLYIMGGSVFHPFFGKTEYFRLTEYHGITTGNRKTLPAMYVGRSNFNPLVCDGFIYVFGGKNESGNIDQCERFNTYRRSWEQLPRLPEKLRNCLSIEIGDTIYIAGGIEEYGNTSNIIYSMRNQRSLRDHSQWIIQNRTYLNGTNCNILLAKSGLILYVIVNDAVVHTYDTLNDEWTMIGTFSCDSHILNTIECSGKPYAVYVVKKGLYPRRILFGRISFGEACTIDSPVHFANETKAGVPDVLCLVY